MADYTEEQAERFGQPAPVVDDSAEVRAAEDRVALFIGQWRTAGLEDVIAYVTGPDGIDVRLQVSDLEIMLGLDKW